MLTREDNLAAIAYITIRERYGDNLTALRRADILLLVKKAVSEAAERMGGVYPREESGAVQTLMHRIA